MIVTLAFNELKSLNHFKDFSRLILLNPFSTNVPLIHPLKISENFRFSDVFRGYRNGTLVENGLNTLK